VTGAPGTGKSTLVTALAKAIRARGQTVGIIAVDPTSPFTGGAILGDRVRMRDLAGDAGVFIRSMATRGSLGGLARTTRDATRALDAVGFDVIFIETVGAGQSEVDVARMAQSVIVVDAPGMGDDIQAIKAGILEIADILVVNKADRPGADNTVRALRAALELGHPSARDTMTGAGAFAHHRAANGHHTPAAPNGDAVIWLPPVLQTVANTDTGIDAVIAALDAHRQHLRTHKHGTSIERRQIEIELLDRLRERLLEQFLLRGGAASIDVLIADVCAGKIDPRGAVDALLAVARLDLQTSS